MKCLFRLTIITIAFLQGNKAEPQSSLYNFKDIERSLVARPNAAEEFSRKRDQEFNNMARGNEKDIERLYEIALNAQDSSPIKALGTLTNSRTADVLATIVRKDSNVTACAALEILSKMPTDLAAPRLISLLAANTHSVGADKRMIISYLEKHPCEDTETALIRQAEDPSVQTLVLSVLGAIGTSNSLGILKRYAEIGTGTVQSIALSSLKRIEKRIATDNTGDTYEEDFATAPFKLYQQAAKEVRAAMKKEAEDLARQGSQPTWVGSTNEGRELRARVNAIVKETMEKRGKDSAQISQPLDVEPENMNQAVQDTTEEMKDIRARIDLVEAKLSQILLQAMQVSDVRDAMMEYERVLRAKMIEIAPQEAAAIRDAELKDDTLQTLMHQAQMDPEVKQSEEHAKALMIKTMHSIDPNTQLLSKELNTLVARFLALLCKDREDQ